MTDSTGQDSSPRRASDSPEKLDEWEDQAQDWLLTVTDPDVTQDQLAEFQAWYDQTPGHKQAYDDVSHLWHDAEALRAAFAPQEESCNEVVKQRPSPPNVARIAGQGIDRKFMRTSTTGAVFAVCCLFVVLGTDVLTFWRADYSTAVGEQVSITLPDGSIAHLNTDTAIAVNYADARRQISLLRGEALFEVNRNPDRPFTVLALDGSATALGTAFVVKQQGDNAIVTVTEGTVRVASPAPSRSAGAGAEQVVLSAGQQVSYRQGVPPGTVRTIEADRQVAWQHGTIMIENQPLTQAIAELDRYRPGKIVLLANTSQLEPVSARISLDNLDSGLDALAKTHNLAVTRVTGYLLVIH